MYRMLPDHSPRTRNFGEWQPIRAHPAPERVPEGVGGQVDELDFPLEAGADGAGDGAGVDVAGLSDDGVLDDESEPPDPDPPESEPFDPESVDAGVAVDDSLGTDAGPLPDRLSVL